MGWVYIWLGRLQLLVSWQPLLLTTLLRQMTFSNLAPQKFYDYWSMGFRCCRSVYFLSPSMQILSNFYIEKWLLTSKFLNSRCPIFLAMFHCNFSILWPAFVLQSTDWHRASGTEDCGAQRAGSVSPNYKSQSAAPAKSAEKCHRILKTMLRRFLVNLRMCKVGALALPIRTDHVKSGETTIE